jgi:beta-N-acetylhexosaminidase
VFIDQEGGRVQRLGPPSNYWKKYPPGRAYGNLYESNPMAALRTARHVGRLMAEDLMEAGITANCLPVLDVPQPGSHDVIGNRAYSMNIEQVMALARAHAAGFMDGGVLPVVKHIPGHGRAEVDSHHDLPVVKATRDVIYTALDKVHPATLSKKIIKTIIRQNIGFRGLLMTDDLSMRALSGTLPEKCASALAAGCDMLLHCNGKLDEMREVAAASVELKGKALRRAKAALKSARKPQPFDRPAALRDLERIVST